jgi:hypothetical protein
MIRMSAVALMFATTATLSAQDAPAQSPTRPASADASRPTPLKILLVLSRYQGDKKLSSVPYTLSVTANENSGSAKVRMGVQMPIVSQIIGASPTAIPSYNYKDLGTNIDCSATSATDGHYKVTLTVSDSSVYFQEQDAPRPNVPAAPSPMAGIAAFRSFTSTFTVWLRDGQTSQYTSVTDQFSGQVLKIDATLNVLK